MQESVWPADGVSTMTAPAAPAVCAVTERARTERAMADALRLVGLRMAPAGGLAVGMADVATVLWTSSTASTAADPHWPDRDRFVLSPGYGAPLLYALLHLTGHAGMDEAALASHRQLGSPAAGHPDQAAHPAIEATTGPLGQGLGMAVGMALAERLMAARFGKSLVDHRTWVLATLGDLMEGVSHEAASLAGHLRLEKLMVLLEDDSGTAECCSALAGPDDALRRFAALGWATRSVDAHDPAAIACRAVAGRAVPQADSAGLPHHARPGLGARPCSARPTPRTRRQARPGRRRGSATPGRGALAEAAWRTTRCAPSSNG